MKHSSKYETQTHSGVYGLSGVFGAKSSTSSETIDKLVYKDNIDMSICYAGADFSFEMGEHPNNNLSTQNNVQVTNIERIIDGSNIKYRFSKEYKSELSFNIPLNVAFVRSNKSMTPSGVDFFQPCILESNENVRFNYFDSSYSAFGNDTRFVTEMNIDDYIYKVPNSYSVFDTNDSTYKTVDFDTLLNDKNNRYFMSSGGLDTFGCFTKTTGGNLRSDDYKYIAPVFVINEPQIKGIFCVTSLFSILQRATKGKIFQLSYTNQNLSFSSLPYTDFQKGIYFENVIHDLQTNKDRTIGSKFPDSLAMNYDSDLNSLPENALIGFDVYEDFCIIKNKYKWYDTGGGINFSILFSSQLYIKMLASFGCYITPYNKSAQISSVHAENIPIYIGEMLANGRTTGKLIKSTELPETAPNYSGSIEHEYFTPVIPVKPETDEEQNYDLENMKISWVNTNSSPFTKAYVCTSQDLKQLSENIIAGEDIPVGLDLFNSIIGIYYYPFSVSNKIDPVQAEEIIIAGWHSQVNCLPLTSVKGLELVASIPITKQFNNFRDFPPYTIYNLYLPYVGQIQLDGFCVGHTINVFYAYDFLSGTCKVCLFMDNILYKQFSGVMGVSREITSVETGLKREAVITGVVNSLVHTAENITAYVDEKEVGTLGNLFGGLVSDLTTTGINQNKSFKSTAGATSTLIDVIQAEKCYLTIVAQNCVIPDGYGHEYGYILNEKRVLSNVSGFTVCENVDTSTLQCTEEEKQMIKNILETGVYL